LHGLRRKPARRVAGQAQDLRLHVRWPRTGACFC
jgi:hypothetical protein